MSITVTPDTTAMPPRFEVTVATPDGSAVTSISVTRTANGTTSPIRFAATAGPSPRLVNDYEAPWGVPVVYTATVTHGSTTETYTATAATLAPAFPWAIHPTTPSLSVCLDTGDPTVMGVIATGTVGRAATTVKHRIIGAKYQLVTKTGPRAASTGQLSLATVTPLEQDAIWAAVDDQTPLLIQFPAGWGWDWEDGYYDVGDVTADRFIQYGPEPRRVFTLPLERVEAPAGNQQPERTWADVLSGFATWTDVAAAYADWTGVETDTRR